jgi:hypothetical protein
MAAESLWDQHNVTGLIRDILRSVPQHTQYSAGRPFMTTYQLAIEFANRHPQVASALAPSTGGQGQGPFALTTYIARWLPQRIRTQSEPDLELAFLAPLHLSTLECDNNGVPMAATTNQAGWNSTMFRFIDNSQS